LKKRSVGGNMWQEIKGIKSVLELRTGFLAFVTSIIGGLMALVDNGSINWILFLLMVSASYLINIIANVANELGGNSKEDKVDTIHDDYSGASGLVRGDTTKKKAAIVLFLLLLISGGLGLLIVLISGMYEILVVGIICVLFALGYALGPKPYIKYPTSEPISGIMVGSMPLWIAYYIQVGHLTNLVIIFGLVFAVLVAELMLVNNISDFNKDLGFRKSYPHVVGFYNAILSIKVYEIIVVILFLISYLIGEFSLLKTIITVCIYLYTTNKMFYFEFLKIKEPIPMMKGIYVPKYLKSFYLFSFIFGIIIIL